MPLVDITSTESLVAPWLSSEVAPALQRKWEGIVRPRPWQYKVTATFAHLETPDLIPTVVELLRLQTARPYIIIVDTGSSAATLKRLEQFRDEDVEIHHIRGHGYRWASSCIAAATDLAFALCQTDHMFTTHVDCFLRSRYFLQDLLNGCTKATPVIGYQMSPRDWLTDQWKGMVSHTATMWHMPTMRRIGATWSLDRANECGKINRSSLGVGQWPDTETGINFCLQDAGIVPELIGDETNYERFVDDNLDHCRSFAGSRVYDEKYHSESGNWIVKALEEAELRIKDWSGQYY